MIPGYWGTLFKNRKKFRRGTPLIRHPVVKNVFSKHLLCLRVVYKIYRIDFWIKFTKHLHWLEKHLKKISDLIHKFCEKWNFLKKTSKNAIFLQYRYFLEIYELNFFQNFFTLSTRRSKQGQELLWKSVRWILRSSYVLLTHNWKRIFANPCEISNVPLRKNFRFLKSVPQDQGTTLLNFCVFLFIIDRERIFLRKSRV